MKVRPRQMDWTTILVTLIGSVATITTTVITSRSLAKREKMHNAKQSIEQLILEDEFNYAINHRIPQNYQRIMHEFEIYSNCGGNSYVHEKVDEYKTWFHSIETVKD